MVDTISDLSDLASKLNQQSDRLNSIISTTNAKLEKLNIGIEVWLEQTPIDDEDFQDDSKDQTIDRHREVTLLGYAKVDGRWQLAVKHATFQTRTDEDGQYGEIVNPAKPSPRLKPAGRFAASRCG